jgi:hypothetical protein
MGVTQKELRSLVRLRFVKAAEYHARGVVHFHAIIRLDGSTDDDSFAPLPPGRPIFSRPPSKPRLRPPRSPPRLAAPALPSWSASAPRPIPRSTSVPVWHRAPPAGASRADHPQPRRRTRPAGPLAASRRSWDVSCRSREPFRGAARSQHGLGARPAARRLGAQRRRRSLPFREQPPDGRGDLTRTAHPDLVVSRAAEAWQERGPEPFLWLIIKPRPGDRGAGG